MGRFRGFSGSGLKAQSLGLKVHGQILRLFGLGFEGSRVASGIWAQGLKVRGLEVQSSSGWSWKLHVQKWLSRLHERIGIACIPDDSSK